MPVIGLMLCLFCIKFTACYLLAYRAKRDLRKRSDSPASASPPSLSFSCVSWTAMSLSIKPQRLELVSLTGLVHHLENCSGCATDLHISTPSAGMSAIKPASPAYTKHAWEHFSASVSPASSFASQTTLSFISLDLAADLFDESFAAKSECDAGLSTSRPEANLSPTSDAADLHRLDHLLAVLADRSAQDASYTFSYQLQSSCVSIHVAHKAADCFRLVHQGRSKLDTVKPSPSNVLF